MRIKYTGIIFACLLVMINSGCIRDVSGDKRSTPVPACLWISDLGNGLYRNPVLYSDYSDPDVIRIGNDFYCVASSFSCVPGLPILHSRDLVNWTILGYALEQLLPAGYYSSPRHGQGIWAPSIRYHNGEYYIYYGDPDRGIYVLKSTRPEGPWKGPILVMEGKGYIDPCPFWDDDGKAYIVHAYAKSRAGFNSIIALRLMTPEGTMVLGKGAMIFDGHEKQPTIEGPKIYKRNGWYYIFAPAGGVINGWQAVLRSRTITGPYEDRIVMHQGKTNVNGPHQGAWIELQSGESWFVHFQDAGAAGRIMHLQPMIWNNDWPVIGKDEGDGIGEPVAEYKKPDVGSTFSVTCPATSDDFDSSKIGLQWQWEADPQNGWYSLTEVPGSLRLYCVPLPDSTRNLRDVPNLLLQKIPAPVFSATTRITPHFTREMERAGIGIFGSDYALLSIRKAAGGYMISMATCMGADSGNGEKLRDSIAVTGPTVDFRVEYGNEDSCRCSYSIGDNIFHPLGSTFKAVPGKWVGAKIGVFSVSETGNGRHGDADIDWVRFGGAE